MNFRLFLSPFFINKYYLFKAIKKIADEGIVHGEIIDIGCGEKPYKNLFTTSGNDYKGIDFETYSKNNDFAKEKPDYYFGKNYLRDFLLPFKSGSYDSAVSFQVLEHHQKPAIFFKETARVLKKGGVFLFSSPFIGGLHEVPHDYQRLTEYQISLLLKEAGFSVVEAKKTGSIFSTLVLLYAEAVNNLALKHRKSYFWAIILMPSVLIFSYLSLILDRIFITDEIFINYLVIAKKI